MKRPLRTSLIFFGGLLTIAGIVLAGWTAMAALSQHDVRAQQIFPFTANNLVIDTDNGGVTLEPGEPGKVTVDRKLTDSVNGPDPTWSLEGNRLKLRLHCPSFFGIACGGSYRIKVPLNVPLDVSSDNGGISASGLRQDLTFSTDNGHLDVSDSTGNLRLTSDNGGITTSRVNADQVWVQTGNGGVRLRFDSAPGNVRVRTDNGGVRVTVPEDQNTYQVRTHSGNGGIENGIDNDSRSKRSIDVGTSNGGITLDRAPVR
ncbi:DUF4097 family beta strand repeat-containing protein [Embleya sp. AB8]|uniref:DUF4097 family beta strand repeat-containing protein n=1 Tax=Embleya sp. AB8 TaxID=3156304 RepID=UPI003C7585A4